MLDVQRSRHVDRIVLLGRGDREAPQVLRIDSRIGSDAERPRLLVDAVELLRRKLGERLVRNRAAFARGRVRGHRRRRAQRGRRLDPPSPVARGWKQIEEGLDWRAHDAKTGPAAPAGLAGGSAYGRSGFSERPAHAQAPDEGARARHEPPPYPVPP